MGKKTGAMIKQARTSAKMTQEQLARELKGLTASDISKAERGEAELTQAALKQIAKITGVTQASLLNAAKDDEPAAKPAAKSAAKNTKTAKADTELKLTAAEKTLVELYRKADADTKKKAMQALKGEKNEMEQIVSSLLGDTFDKIMKKR